MEKYSILLNLEKEFEGKILFSEVGSEEDVR